MKAKSWIIKKIKLVQANNNDSNLSFPSLKMKYVKMKIVKYNIGLNINGVLKNINPIILNKVACPIMKDDIATCSI